MGKFVKVDHYHLHYRDWGRSHHPAILFLHGFLGDCEDFQGVISVLSHQFYCIAVDLPGHGQTQVWGDESSYTMPAIAQGLIQMLDALEMTQCSLVGYSMGGRLALYLALHFPTYFPHVVLESASPGLKTEAERRARIQRDTVLAKRLETEDFPVFLAQWYDQPLFSSMKGHREFDAMLRRRLQNHPGSLAQSLRQMGTGSQPSLWEKLQDYSGSMLLLAGEWDEKFIRIQADMAALCQSATVCLIEGCGHTIHLEQADGMAQQIKYFLTNKAVGEL